jgi:hypothetical protein
LWGLQPGLNVLAAQANPAAVITAHDGVEEGLARLRAEGRPIFVVGSLYVAAEVKAATLGLDPAQLWYL